MPDWRLVTGAIGGGLIYGLAFPPSPLPLLVTVAWVPALIAWSNAPDARRAWFSGLVFHSACFALAFSWPLRHELAHVAAASLLPLVLLVLLLSVPFAIGYFVRSRLGLPAGVIALVAFHLVCEAALTLGPTAMPWPLAGNTLSDVEQVRMLASIGGVQALSAWALSVNALIVLAIRSARARRVAFAGAAVAVVSVGWLSGDTLRGARAESGRVTVALVQPSIPAHEWAEVENRGRLEALVSLTDSLQDRAGSSWLTIWPETALPPCEGSFLCDDVVASIADVVEHSGGALLSGAIAADAPDRRTPWKNSAVLFEEMGRIDRYDKVRLVPFAEGVPFAARLPALAALALDAGGVASYTAGNSRDVIEVDGVGIGPLICFESIFPADARDYVRTGADVLVVVSQDGWWGDTRGHRQHLAFTRLRAIETGRPVVFVAATGTSAAIAADGSTIEAIPYGERRAIKATIPLVQGTTPFVRYGDLVSPTAALLSAMLLLWSVVTRQRPAGDADLNRAS